MKIRRLVAFLLIFALSVSMVPMVSATGSSAEIQAEIDRLEEEAEQIEEERAALEEEISQVTGEALTHAEEKYQIDMEIQLLRQEVENIDAQVMQFNLLIAEKQAELDTMEAEHSNLLSRYRQRMRAIQERGNISIWSVLLSAESFADMINSKVMIEEIARVDQNMLEELRESAQGILQAKDELAVEKANLEAKKLELAEAEEQLAERRAASDALLAELNADKERLEAEIIRAEEEEARLIAEIAQREEEYNEALREENGGFLPDPNEHGFIFPVDPSGFVYLSSPYGMRYHPISGSYTMHNGVDFAAYLGTKTYAAKSGVVTTAGWGGGWGNYVVINHGDGFSTLYAHFDSIAVSVGDIVSRGQVIGYVGSTGNSTGPHLHFTMYLNGSTVNPMLYVSLP